MTRSRSGQYLTGMCIAGLGVCAGGWLVVTALISVGPVSASTEGKWDHAAVSILATGAGLALVAVITFACWAMAWRRELRADGVLLGEARRRSRRDARRQARQAAREARLEAAAARRQARQARREARAMGKRERAIQAESAQAAPAQAAPAQAQPAREVVSMTGEAGIIPRGAGFAEEPEGVRPPNADRVLAQLRDLLGPLIIALDAEPTTEPGRTIPAPRESRESREPRRAQEARADDLVAVCADGVISYDAEEAW